MKIDQDTNYAPAKRKSLIEVKEEAKLFFKNHYEELLNVLPNIAIIVNEERQVVFLNETVIQMLGIKNIEEVLGARPGEIFNCIHSNDYIHGCGTGENCRFCGAVNVVLQSLKTNDRTSGECHLTSNFDGNIVQFDLSVTAQPFDIKEKKFIMVFFSDISNQKRQELLEKAFLHDLINILTSLAGSVELFPIKGLDSTQKQFFNQIKIATRILVEEFRAQRDLITAENNELVINSKKINSIEIIKTTIEMVKYQTIAVDREIKIDMDSISVMIETDSRLINRILLNLVKNALEASVSDEVVKIGCYLSNKSIVFWVKNPNVITKAVKSQIFQRSFSTKGVGRGIGTYSVKLFTEKYLGGKVDFQSTKEKGTIFYVHLPIIKK